MTTVDKKKLESLIGDGRSAFENCDVNGAIEIWKGVIKNNPENALTYNLIGAAYLQKGDLKEAKDYIERALQRDGKNPVFMYNLAMVEMACDNFADVVKLLELAVSHEPGD